jgi:hypothetical protein
MPSRIVGSRLLDFSNGSDATAPDGTAYMIQSERNHLRERRVFYFDIRRAGERWTGDGSYYVIEGDDRSEYGFKSTRQAAINAAERHAREFHGVPSAP